MLNYETAGRDARLANNVLKEKNKSIEKLKVIISISHIQLLCYIAPQGFSTVFEDLVKAI